MHTPAYYSLFQKIKDCVKRNKNELKLEANPPTNSFIVKYLVKNVYTGKCSSYVVVFRQGCWCKPE